VDLRLLGPVEVRVDDRPIELGPRKQRAVLAMLALQVGRTVSSDRLVVGLWGEDPPSSAPKMVQLYISHLRPLLEGSGACIVTHGRGYELQVSHGDVDAIRVERLLNECRAREALALWHGEALADVADEPFAAAEIRRLDELRLRAAESAIAEDLAAGRHAGVIGELEALVAEQPLREHLRAQHMLALYRSGRQSDALAAYSDARAQLVDQIGVEPGGELRRLQDAILAQDPALDFPGTANPEPATSARPPPRRGPPMRVLVAAAILVVVGVTAFGVIRVLEPDGLAGIGENAVGRIDPDSGLITKHYGVGKSPSAVVGGGGSVWIANAADGTVSRIDREHDGAVTTITVGGNPAALAFGAGSLWVADSDSREVAQIDPGANKVVARHPVGNAPRALAATSGAVWVASGVDGRIQRIDLDRGRPRAPILVGANPSAIAAGAGALWVASEEAATVTRIDPRTGSVLPPIRVGNGPSALAVGEGAVWVVNRHDGTLSRIDPRNNKVSWTGEVGADPTAVAVGAGSVWVAGGEERTVRRVDPDGPRVVEKLPVGSSAAAIAVAGGSVWTAAVAPQTAHRGGTLRVLVPSPRDSLVPMDWLDWHAYTTWATFQLSSLAYDGLVAYRRVEGAAGATIVGALATSAPAPSPDGRTYVFSLRPGIRFSDGRPVRPEDFRASMERFLRVVGGDYSPFYSRIAGAPQCIARPARCDLSKGIETDARARTITIHLTRPDRDLLHKLTLSPGFVVPADSPVRSTTGRTPPGTGPYRVASWRARRGGLLVRNPHFRATQARPAGFVDRIRVGVRDERTVEAQISDVQRGDADVALVANTFASYVRPDRMRALIAGSPSRVHSGPAATTDWVFLNTRLRPFDSLRVRRALNLAFDRARVVELSGGVEAGRPACQVIPAAFPGYAPYCPYTAARSADGGWTAPDMERARRLVKASGRAGERIRIVGTDYPASRVEVGRYLVGLLNRLGFRATQHVYRAFVDEPTGKALAREQAGFVGWGADYLSPSTFIESQFTCAALAGPSPLNFSGLCDRTLDGLVDRALDTPPAEAAGAWAAADRRVTNLAPVVPMTSRRSVVLVSKRVGNVQTHGQWFTLLDQMWVR
jgi:ABC-type transport system substrate-binding protein/DNA-binding SARP family transcriptional activator